MPHNRAPASPQLAGLASGRASVSMDDGGTRGAAAGGRVPRLPARDRRARAAGDRGPVAGPGPLPVPFHSIRGYADGMTG